jgi:hypothetical protein
MDPTPPAPPGAPPAESPAAAPKAAPSTGAADKPPGALPSAPPAPGAVGPSGRPLPPKQDCPDVERCYGDASQIGHLCGFGPICGTCVVYKTIETRRGLLLGTCRVRGDRGEFPCTAPICASYVPRQGALDARGKPTGGSSAVTLTIARQAQKVGVPTKREPRAAPPLVRRAPIPDGPLEEFEMTREELKALIREAMDEERGGGAAVMAGKWEGGTVLLKPQDPALQAKELPIDALLHKVVMVRDKLRVLEQKLNAHPKLTDHEKVELQAYITGCYGSLTTFNVLFRDREDGFVGTGGK